MVQFLPRITYVNQQPLAANLLRQIQVPRGASARTPTFVTQDEMFRREPPRVDTSTNTIQIRVVQGLTDPTFSVSFENFERQWQPAQVEGDRRRYRKFQGGNVYFDLTVEVLVADRYQRADAALALIIEHELLHVADEVDLVSAYLPALVGQDRGTWVAFLKEQTPVDEPTFQHVFVDQVPMLDDRARVIFAGSRFAQWIFGSLWLPEHNRRATRRDSAAEYAAFQRRLDALTEQHARRQGAGR